ncbi:hypothetical protein BDB00DRAFT_125225 [Zychaea mexicana]|uniref:uncharacterized protein n=1 Tax=Zychaea mexicana TaxID=64656 RepID=UPI0022FEAD9A|nr:uncharacterized protein BDB00DRAFT_125225 [Zychaea mexicana]KAI9484667.1 hypothetical protein BDB00DRAFT_125225 [Zychaea mexicana]
MGRLRRSRTHHGIRDIYRKYRTRNYARDLDQIHDDIKPENVDKYKNQALDPDKPGLGQNYCVDRHFINPDALKEHVRGKTHKKRVKLLKEEPYTQAEADAAAGLGKADNGKRGGRSLASGDVDMEDQ